MLILLFSLYFKGGFYFAYKFNVGAANAEKMNQGGGKINS
jgi:hypothetical protein